MACFLVPVSEAIVTTVIQKMLKSREENSEKNINKNCFIARIAQKKFSKKLGWLNKLLWGGSVLLAFEHIWHGEIVPYFPFLTAVKNPQDTVSMLNEMATVGVTMAAFVTFVWVLMVIVSKRLERKPLKTSKTLVNTQKI